MTGATTAGPYCLALLKHFEKGPPEGCRLTDDGAALEAYLCSAGKATVGFGCTFHPDGSPIQLGETITEAQVEEYMLAALERVSADVRELTAGAALTQFQFDALASFMFNLGRGNLAGSSQLLPAVLAKRFMDAAEAFGSFMRAWGTKNGKPYRMSLRGLLIRRYAEAAVFMGYDFAEACDADHIAMPKQVVWNAKGADRNGEPTGRFEDVVDEAGKTRLATIMAIARLHPLQASPASSGEGVGPVPATAQSPARGQLPERPVEAKPPAPLPTPPASAKPAQASVPESPATPSPPSVGVSTGGKKPAEGVQPSPPVAVQAPRPLPPKVPAPGVGTKPISPNTVDPHSVPYSIDPNAGLKPMEETDRWRASLSQNAGMVALRIARYGFFGAGAKTGADLIEGDAVFMQAAMMFIGVGAVWVYGTARKAYGDWCRVRAERAAVQAMC